MASADEAPGAEWISAKARETGGRRSPARSRIRPRRAGWARGSWRARRANGSSRWEPGSQQRRRPSSIPAPRLPARGRDHLARASSPTEAGGASWRIRARRAPAAPAGVVTRTPRSVPALRALLAMRRGEPSQPVLSLLKRSRSNMVLRSCRRADDDVEGGAAAVQRLAHEGNSRTVPRGFAAGRDRRRSADHRRRRTYGRGITASAEERLGGASPTAR